MMFNLKSAFLLSLVAFSAAQPTFDLQPRAKVPDNLTCDGRTWTKAQINASLKQAKNLESSGYAYPKYFSNKGGNGQPLFNAQGDLYEFPLLDPVWTSGTPPGTFRVIMKENYAYVGVTNKLPGTGDIVHKC